MWALPPEWFQWFAIIVVIELGLLLLGICVIASRQWTLMSDLQRAIQTLQQMMATLRPQPPSGDQDKTP